MDSQENMDVFARLLRESQRTMTFEEREHFSQWFLAKLPKVSLEEMRLARARLADWLIWASENVDTLRVDPKHAIVWQQSLLRGELLNIEINRREVPQSNLANLLTRSKYSGPPRREAVEILSGLKQPGRTK